MDNLDAKGKARFTAHELVWACVGCVTDPDDIAAMRGDPGCANARDALADLASELKTRK